MPALMNFEWPGNVRQLRNVIHRACVESETNTICRLDFGVGSELRIAPQTSLSGIATAELPGGYQNMPLEDIERFVILSRIERCRGNKTEAAAELGVTARTLRNKLARWNELKKVG